MSFIWGVSSSSFRVFSGVDLLQRCAMPKMCRSKRFLKLATSMRRKLMNFTLKWDFFLHLFASFYSISLYIFLQFLSFLNSVVQWCSSYTWILCCFADTKIHTETHSLLELHIISVETQVMDAWVGCKFQEKGWIVGYLWSHSYKLGCPPSQDSSGKWRFRLGSPTKNTTMLVGWLLLGGGKTQLINFQDLPPNLISGDGRDSWKSGSLPGGESSGFGGVFFSWRIFWIPRTAEPPLSW